ncbi:hypothetical protein FRC08_013252 [Ceratobasidium sp. 394]|nr:hypothetical protein FRC08_013252 [Ceratobasidium sp. 394]
MFNLSMPIGSLPDEILASIFDIAIVTSSTPDHPWYHRQDVLTTISSVSTRWRQVAIQMRSFWSNIHITKSPNCREPFSSDLVALWLERSRGAPIHIYASRRLDRSYIERLTSLLRPYASHISSIVASVRNDNPSLRTLRLRNMTIQTGTSSTASPIELPALQLLDLVGLDSAGVRWLMSALFPGQDELDFRVELLDSANFERAVAQFLKRSNVVALWLHDIPHRTGGPPASQLPVLSSVRVLGLVSAQESLDIAARMFAGTGDTQVARYPNLRTLYLRGHGLINKLGRSRIKHIAKVYPSIAVHLDHCALSKSSHPDTGGSELLLPYSLHHPVRRVFFKDIPLDHIDILDMYARSLLENSRGT